MQAEKVHQLKQIINNLENIVQGKATNKIVHPAPQQQQKLQLLSPSLAEFEQFQTQFTSLAQEIKIEELSKITEVINEAFDGMKQVVEFSYKLKKLGTSQQQEIQKIFIAKLNVLNKFATHKEYKIHFKAIIEGINGIFWVFNHQSPKAIIENAVESSEFHALKVKQLKIKSQTEWYVSFINAIKSLKPYILQNFPTGLAYNSNGSDDISELIKVLNNSTPVSNNSSDQQSQQNQFPQQQQSQVQQQQPQVQQQQISSIRTEMSEYIGLVEKFKNLAEKSNNQLIKDMTPFAVNILDDQFLCILENYKKYSKPTTQLSQFSQAFMANINQINNLDTKKGPLKEHFKPILEGLNVVFWIFNDTPKMMIDSQIESSEFHALKLKKLKIQEETDWYNSFHTSLKYIQQYVLKNYPTGLNWSPSGEKDASALIEQLSQIQQGKTVQQQQQKVAPPPQIGGPPLGRPGGPGGPPSLSLLGLPKNPELLPVSQNQQNSQSQDRGALFDEINVGLDGIKKNLRKVDKKQLKEEISKREVPVTTKVQTTTKAPVTQTVQKKEPKRHLHPTQGLYIENFVDVPMIEVTGEEEKLETKHCIFIDNCKKCAVKISPKVNTIFLNKCEKVQLQFTQCVSSVQLVNSKGITIWCMERCPSIQADKSEQIHISFMKDKDCEVISSNTSEINLTYPKTEDEMAKDTPLPEQFITKWDEEQQKFVTKIFEQVD